MVFKTRASAVKLIWRNVAGNHLFVPATGDLFFNFNEAFIAIFMTLLLAWMTLFAGFGTWSLAVK